MTAPIRIGTINARTGAWEYEISVDPRDARLIWILRAPDRSVRSSPANPWLTIAQLEVLLAEFVEQMEEVN